MQKYDDSLLLNLSCDMQWHENIQIQAFCEDLATMSDNQNKPLILARWDMLYAEVIVICVLQNLGRRLSTRARRRVLKTVSFWMSTIMRERSLALQRTSL